MFVSLKTRLLVAATVALGAAPALAQQAAPAPAAQAASPQVGMTVKDTAGGTVGTVTAVKDGLVTVKTDKHEAALPASAFTASNGSLLFGTTQAQLNAQIEQATSANQAQFKVGATVKGSGGAVVGTVKELDAETATLQLSSGKLVKVPRNGLAAASDGLVMGMTAAQLEAAAAAAS